LSLYLITYLKGCHLNLPGNPAFKAYDNNVWVENDPDGDGLACTGSPPADPDNDNGKGDNAPAPLELSDDIEIKGYWSNATNQDTDGDGCSDWMEVMDLNFDRKVNVSDQVALAKRAGGLAGFGGDPQSDSIYDVNKDGKINVSDQVLLAKNTCTLKPFGIGCSTCPPES